MTYLPRKDLVNPEEIEVHHCWSRCVRQAWLLGRDPLTGQDFSHRRQWIEGLHEYLGSVFAIDLGTLHPMSNHLHNVTRSRPDVAATWSDEEVIWRWKMAWPVCRNGVWGRSPTDAEIEQQLERG